MGGKFYEMRHTDKERRKEDTVSRGGLLEVGIKEMIGGADLFRGDRGPPRNRVCFHQMTLKEGQKVEDSRKKKSERVESMGQSGAGGRTERRIEW